VKGPFLTIDRPYSTGESPTQLIAKGILDPDFAKCQDVIDNPNRPLYVHQLQSIERIEAGDSVVITTGTSSGKTECFLYPILDSILKEKKSGKAESGIRAILLYPMNALVSDQLERLRTLLKNYPEITFASYTGETPENEKDKKRLQSVTISRLPNELNYREQIRETPPDILFTNYSMLEYLLLRPNDSKITSPEAMKNWRFIVLDEAHTYKGALGIEVAFLLRRLEGATQRKPQFILASATLGRGAADLDKIIDFAHSLTNADYKPEDVIFPTRDDIVANQFTLDVDPKDYSLLISNSTVPDAVDPLLKKYISVSSTLPFEQKLYALLSRDKNVFRLYEEDNKKDASKEFGALADYFEKTGMAPEQLVDLVELISQAVNALMKPVFSVKYHMFMRSPDGAFVTLKPHEDLRLIKCDTIGDLKAFTMAICENCGSPYLMGHIIDGTFEQVDEMDLMDENIDQDDFIDYLLLKDYVDPVEYEEAKQDKENTEYAVCSKCGHVYEVDDLNATKCSCGDAYLNYALKVPSTSKAKYCPICDHNGESVVGFHVGKDRATAILAQNLLRAMDSNNQSNTPLSLKTDGNDFFSMPAEKAKPLDLRQFLAFNDSRQQASFFALFFDHNEQHAQMKAMLLELLKENGNKPIGVNELHNQALHFYLENFTKEEMNAAANLQPDDRAWLAILYELTRQEGNYSGENIGLYAFVLDLPKEYSDPQLVSALRSVSFPNISLTQFQDLTRQVLDLFRITPALQYPILHVDDNQLQSYLQYRRFRNGIKLRGVMNGPANCRSLLPVVTKTHTQPNKIVDYVMRTFSLDQKRAEDLITLVWKMAIKTNLLVRYPDSDPAMADAYVLSVDHFSLHSKEDLSFYRCNVCRHVSVYNINDICTTGKCKGKLEKIDPDTAFQNNYYRKNYLSKKANDEIVIYEHDAQLSPAEARRYQKGFNDRQINVLSCSTTFEMGVDIKGLNTVFMRNVPPSPSNYAQRAGRAGRRAQTSAFVLTYCGSNSHDFSWYNKPLEMISGLVDPPVFKLANEKIILRHIMACVLRFYFKKHLSEFSNIETFIANDGPSKVQAYIETKPNEVGDYLTGYVLTTPDLLARFGQFKWVDLLLSPSEGHASLPLIAAMDNLVSELKGYEAAKAEAGVKNNKADFNYYADRIDEINREGIPEAFSRCNVIPRYGFPVDTVKLTIFNPLTGKVDKNHRLERDLSIAISEYAPDSQVVVDKRIYTSRYITLPNHGFGGEQTLEKQYYYQCANCGRINVSDKEFPSAPVCQYCHSANPKFLNRFFIVPSMGFVAETKNMRESDRLKPLKTYAGEIYHLGGGKQINQMVRLGKALTITTSEDDQLLIMNTSPFYYCPVCGYAELDKTERQSQKEQIHKRDNFSGVDCTNTTLQRVALGHKYSTDVVTLTIGIDLDQSQALSTLYAILEGISIQFEIERRDINGVVERDAFGHYNTLILFDAVPGGAGHVKRICTAEGMKEALNAAYHKMRYKCCGDGTSCYQCLRNYDNQRFHKYLKRTVARDVLAKLLALADVPDISLADVIDKEKSNLSPSSWGEISGLYIDPETATAMSDNGIPVPEYSSTVLKADSKLPNIGPQWLSWPKHNVIIVSTDSPDSVISDCEALGWHAYKISGLDYQKLKENLK
jgi:hypothetical protein